MFKWIKPRNELTPPEVDRGLRMLLYSGAFGQAMVTLTGGAFLVAFALALGASNRTIGLLAAIGPLAQAMQVPAVLLVESTRARKALVVGGAAFVRLGWLGIAAVPWLVPESQRLPAFLVSLLALSCVASVVGCGFNSWIRDLVPERRMGRYFGRRMAIAVSVAAALSLAAAAVVDRARQAVGNDVAVYTALFAIGALVGLVGVVFLARTPEPRMLRSEDGGLLAVLAQPLKDRNYRRLMAFLGTWGFATSFAAPFFTVYMLKRLDLSMTWVLAMVVLSQLFNVAFFRIWGRLADRFSNKSVLTVAGPLLMVAFLVWPFTTMPETYFLTIPLLVMIHVLGGISTAGVALCTGNLALKIAPRGRATAYLATNALVTGMAATVAPILAGLAADGLADQTLRVDLGWFSGAAESARHFDVPAISLTGLDFVFVAAFVVGLYSLRRLRRVREEGEVTEAVARSEFYAEVRRAARQVSTVGGMRDLTYVPLAGFRRLVGRATRRNGSAADDAGQTATQPSDEP